MRLDLNNRQRQFVRKLGRQAGPLSTTTGAFLGTAFFTFMAATLAEPFDQCFTSIVFDVFVGFTILMGAHLIIRHFALWKPGRPLHMARYFLANSFLLLAATFEIGSFTGAVSAQLETQTILNGPSAKAVKIAKNEFVLREKQWQQSASESRQCMNNVEQRLFRIKLEATNLCVDKCALWPLATNLKDECDAEESRAQLEYERYQQAYTNWDILVNKRIAELDAHIAKLSSE